MKTQFHRMAAYNAWANARLYAMARGLPDEAYRKNVDAFFGSLHGTLNHILVADRIWMKRFSGTGDHPVQLDAILYDDLAALQDARKAEDHRILQFVEGLSDEDLRKDLDYATTKGTPQRNPLRDLLAHFFNHQTHHRGQAHAILTVLGVKAPQSLDLLVMLREKS